MFVLFALPIYNTFAAPLSLPQSSFCNYLRSVFNEYFQRQRRRIDSVFAPQDNIVESLTSRRSGGLDLAPVKYPLRYDGRQIFYDRVQSLTDGMNGDGMNGDEDHNDDDAKRSPSHGRLKSHERRVGEANEHFNPIKGDFSVDVVNTFVQPDTSILEFWVEMVPYISLGVAFIITIMQGCLELHHQRHLNYLRGDNFAKLDRDRGGEIDFKELRRGLRLRGCSDDEIRHVFEVLDIDQNGKVSRKEYEQGKIEALISGRINKAEFFILRPDLMLLPLPRATAAMATVEAAPRSIPDMAEESTEEVDDDLDLPMPLADPPPRSSISSITPTPRSTDGLRSRRSIIGDSTNGSMVYSQVCMSPEISTAMMPPTFATLQPEWNGNVPNKHESRNEEVTVRFLSIITVPKKVWGRGGGRREECIFKHGMLHLQL